MSFLARFILILCISTVFGRRPTKYESKSVEIDTVLEANSHINKKAVKNEENTSHKGTSPNGIISVSQKPKQVDPEHKLDGDSKFLKNLNSKMNESETLSDDTKDESITTKYKKTYPEIEAIYQDNQIAQNPSKPVQGNRINRSVNIIKVLKLKPKNKDHKTPEAVANNNLEKILTSNGKRITRSMNDVTIVSEHNNLLSLMIDVINKLMQFRGLSLSEQNWSVVSTLFESFLSVLFGPNIHIWWPMFARIGTCRGYEITDVIEDTDSALDELCRPTSTIKSAKCETIILSGIPTPYVYLHESRSLRETLMSSDF